jgi:plastocyanin
MNPGRASMRYHLTVVAFAAAILSSVIISAPASAATLDVTVTCSSGTVTATPSSVAVTPGDLVRLINNTGGNLIAAGSNITPDPLSISDTGGTTGTFTVVQNGFVPLNVVTGVCPVGGAPAFGSLQLASGGGGGSSSGAVAAPQTFELALAPADGTTCTNSSQSGLSGTWMTLPGANDCTPPASKPNAKLLGWSTSPTFPVAVAQQQINNGWGAYETFNDAGQLTGVFIPAGGATLVSAAGKLYAIWSE